MATWSEMLTDSIYREAADLARLEASTVRSVLHPTIRDARKELMGRLRVEWDLLSWDQRNRMRAFIGTFTDLLEQEAFGDSEEQLRPVLEKLMTGTRKQAASEINTVLRVPLISTTAPPQFYAKVMDRSLIEGQPLFSYRKSDGSKGWWDNLRENSKEQMAREIRKSLVMGESTGQAARRLLGSQIRNGVPIDGVLGKASRNAEAIARTSIHAVTNATRAETYEENDDIIEGLQSLATLDSRTTMRCRAYDGLQWTLPNYRPIGGHGRVHQPPPRHFRCRSVMMPILAGLDAIDRKARSMGYELPETVRASKDGPQKGQNSNMQTWMSKQSTEEQNKMLGTRRAELWRSGKVGLKDLVDSQGRNVPVSELERLAERRSLPN